MQQPHSPGVGMMTIEARRILQPLREHPHKTISAIERIAKKPQAHIQVQFNRYGLKRNSAWVTICPGCNPLKLTRPVSIRVRVSWLISDSKTAKNPSTKSHNLDASKVELQSTKSTSPKPKGKLNPSEALELLKRQMSDEKFYQGLRTYAKKVVSHSLDHHSLNRSKLNEYYPLSEFESEVLHQAYLKTYSAFSKMGFNGSTVAPYMKISMQTVSGEMMKKAAAYLMRSNSEINDHTLALPEPVPHKGDRVLPSDHDGVTVRPVRKPLIQEIDEPMSDQFLGEVFKKHALKALENGNLDPVAVFIFKACIWGEQTHDELARATNLTVNAVRLRIRKVSDYLKENLNTSTIHEEAIQRWNTRDDF